MIRCGIRGQVTDLQEMCVCLKLTAMTLLPHTLRYTCPLSHTHIHMGTRSARAFQQCTLFSAGCQAIHDFHCREWLGRANRTSSEGSKLQPVPFGVTFSNAVSKLKAQSAIDFNNPRSAPMLGVTKRSNRNEGHKCSCIFRQTRNRQVKGQ